MTDRESPLNYNSADFERVAIELFRTLATSIPQASKVFRETWGCSTVLCIDFEACPHLLPGTRTQIHNLTVAAQKLGLTNSIIFRIGNRTIGWEKINSSENETIT